MEETDKCCWTCKYAIDEGDILCVYNMNPGTYKIIGQPNGDPNYGCENWEEMEVKIDE